MDPEPRQGVPPRERGRESMYMCVCERERVIDRDSHRQKETQREYMTRDNQRDSGPRQGVPPRERGRESTMYMCV